MDRKLLSGFTLLELMIVVAVLAILAAVGSPIYRGFIKKSELDSVSQGITYDLKRARANSMTGENGLKWGIHFNSVSGGGSYQIFSTPRNYADVSTTIESTIYLPKLIEFTDPASGFTRDIIFDRIRGSLTASSSVTVRNSVDNIQKTINVNASGNVY